MSEIGDIYGRYHSALNDSLADYQHERSAALAAATALYEPVFRHFVRRFPWIQNRESEAWRRTLNNLREYYGVRDRPLQFAAIDGTCGKEAMSEMIVFYGASYAQQGELNIDQQGERLEYRRWSPSEDTSVVAYLPVPLSRMGIMEGEDWLFNSSNDADQSSAALAHTSLMQLAEIYLAYRRVNEDSPPQIVLLDHSLSSILLSCDVMHLLHPPTSPRPKLGWIGAQVAAWGRCFELADGVVCHAHPMNSDLEVPSWRHNALAECLVARLTDFWQIGGPSARIRGVKLDEIITEGGFTVDREQLRERVRNLSARYEAFTFNSTGDEVVPVAGGRSLTDRWQDLRTLFESVGRDLFRERRLTALQLRIPNAAGAFRTRWMDTNDLKFLIGLGLRLLIETCWRKRILLLGVAKDSSSRFLSRNFLGVMAATGRMTVPTSDEPAATDRLLCEMFPLIDSDLEQPWSTIEFDAAFMTLRAMYNQANKLVVTGVRGDVIVPSDGLFLRSLIQMFLQRREDKVSPLMGHALFLDRIAHPQLDARRRIATPIATSDSQVRPILFENAEATNPAQDMAVLIAYLLTRNCFPEAIGQPDPLHRADQGAKALGKRINDLVRSSVNRFRSNPLAWSFRDTRTQGGG